VRERGQDELQVVLAAEVEEVARSFIVKVKELEAVGS